MIETGEARNSAAAISLKSTLNSERERVATICDNLDLSPNQRNTLYRDVDDAASRMNRALTVSLSNLDI